MTRLDRKMVPRVCEGYLRIDSHLLVFELNSCRDWLSKP